MRARPIARAASPKSRLRSFIEEPKPPFKPLITATDLRSLGFGASLRIDDGAVTEQEPDASPKSRLRSFIEDRRTSARNAAGHYLRSLGFGASLRSNLPSMPPGDEPAISEVSASELH